MRRYTVSIPVQAIGVRQRKVEYLHFHVDTSAVSTTTAGTGGLIEGTYHATIIKAAADAGLHTITLNKASRRKIHVVGCTSTGNTGVAGTVDVRFSFTASSTAVIVSSEVGGTNADHDFDITLAVFRSPDQQ
jgi:hypothetical protein